MLGSVSSRLSFFCLLQALPGPPTIYIKKAYISLYPIKKDLCPYIDPYRDVIFNLHTRENPTEHQILVTGEDILLKASNMNFNHPTIFFFHGFTESAYNDDSVQFRKNYLAKGKYNVIIVNAERLLAGMDYVTASSNCFHIAMHTTKFIEYLVSKGLHLSQTHLIGQSLGAHIAGLIGGYVTSGKISRITALDPAGPLFDLKPKSKRLDESDAEFVDVIHSNSGFFGTKRSCGHVDFWPNGGTKQPKSWDLGPTGLTDFLLTGNHMRGYKLYAKSILQPNFYVATKCTSFEDYQNEKCAGNERIFMGIDANREARGDFYLETGAEAQSF